MTDIAYTLIEAAKLNGIDPQAWLADTLARIPDYKSIASTFYCPGKPRRRAARPDTYLQTAKTPDSVIAFGLAKLCVDDGVFQ